MGYLPAWHAGRLPSEGTGGASQHILTASVQRYRAARRITSGRSPPLPTQDGSGNHRRPVDQNPEISRTRSAGTGVLIITNQHPRLAAAGCGGTQQRRNEVIGVPVAWCSLGQEGNGIPRRTRATRRPVPRCAGPQDGSGRITVQVIATPGTADAIACFPHRSSNAHTHPPRYRLRRLVNDAL